MHPRFVEILCCPATGESLNLEVEEVSARGSIERGFLVNESGTHRYPIVRAIPRFVSQEVYAGTFGYEWQRWSRVQFEAENVGRPMAGHTTKMFDAITGFSAGALENKLVVEFGCGPGRFIDIVRQRGGTAVGIDLSIAVEPARQNFRDDPEVLILQADILNPPFRKGTFDVGYTIGVLHHTPQPAEGFKSLASCVKIGGLVACTVYPKEGLYALNSVHRLRRIYHGSKKFLGNKGALIYSYFSAYILYHILTFLRRNKTTHDWSGWIETEYLVNLNIPDAKWRVLDVFDAITPFYASTHTPEEVTAWFVEANCTGVVQRPWGTASFAGIKGEGDADFLRVGSKS